MNQIIFVRETYLVPDITYLESFDKSKYDSDQMIYIPSGKRYNKVKVQMIGNYCQLTIELINVINSSIWYCQRSNIEFYE